MSVTEHKGTLKYMDESGNINVMYPNTKKECVEGLEDALKDVPEHTHDASEIETGTLSSERLPVAPVGKGGTGKSSVTAESFLVGNGTGAMQEKTAAQVLALIGAVPTARKINGKELSDDIELNAENVGARASDWTPSASDLPIIPASKGGFGHDFSSIPANALIRNSSDNTQLWYTQTANGALYATGDNGTPKFGTLPVAQGGTGHDFSDAPANALVRNSGDNTGLWYTQTANGALYATAENGAVKFGTLPVAQGGTGNTTGKAPSATKLANYYSSRPTSANIAPDGSGGVIAFKATGNMTTGAPNAGEGHILHFFWDNNGGYDAQLCIPDSSAGHVEYRKQSAGTWGSWIEVLDASNYTKYLGASGGTVGMVREFDSGALSASTYSYSGLESKFYVVTLADATGILASAVIEYKVLSTTNKYFWLDTGPSTSTSIRVRINSAGYPTFETYLSDGYTLSRVCGYY